MNMGLNKMVQEIHAANVEKGFYNNPREIGTLLMLVVSELSEALEADRKGKKANITAFLDPNRDDGDFSSAFETFIKDSFEDEIADAMIRLLDLCGYMGIDIERHIRLKLKYNSLRPYKHGKKY